MNAPAPANQAKSADKAAQAKAVKFDFKPYLERVKSEFMLIYESVRDRGPQRFARAAGFGLGLSVVAYMVLYSPPQKRMARLQGEIDQARKMAEAGARYRDLRNNLFWAYSALPPSDESDQWLSNSIRDSLGGLVTDSISPVLGSEANGILMQSESVIVSISFPEFFAWLLRIEGAKPMLHVESFALSKKAEGDMNQIGRDEVNCTISTAIPKQRYR